jgi:hypothetical protein
MTVLEEAAKEHQAQQEEVKQTALVARDNSQFSSILDGPKFTQIQRAANLFSSSKLVPQHFQGDMPSVFVAIQMAIRLEVDPFMLMQNVYMIHGKPGMESKLVIALMNKRGPFTGPVQWKLEGQGMGRKCTAFATHEVTGEVCEYPLTMEDAKKEGWLDKPGSKWKTLPDLMLRYRSAAFLARLYCPEVTMGVQTVEEIEDVQGSTPTGQIVRLADAKLDVPAHLGTKENIEKVKAETQEAPPIDDKPVPETKPKKKRGRKPNKAKKEEALKMLRETLQACNYDAETDDDVLSAIRVAHGLELEVKDLEEVTLEQVKRTLESVDKMGGQGDNEEGSQEKA